jgi:capsular polysaccharide transport system permease protein
MLQARGDIGTQVDRSTVPLLLPKAKTVSKFKRSHSFLLAVVLPTMLAAIYLFFFASSQYVSEFRFTIQATTFNPTSNNSSSGSSAGQSPVSASGSSSAAAFYVMDYMVADYLQSSQVVADLQKQLDLAGMYNKPSIDILNRFWWNDGSIERLTKYWRYFGIYAWFDTTTGLADVQITTFSPQDAAKITPILISLCEKLVNDQTMRQRDDAIRFAEQAVKDAEDRLKKTLEAESQFRLEHQSIDPSINGSATLALVGTLQQGLAEMRQQEEALAKYLSPNAPTLVLLRTQIASAEKQLTSVAGQIGGGDVSHGAGKGISSITAAMKGYETIQNDRNFAAANYNAMLQLLAQTKLDATVQHAYLTPYVNAAAPQDPTYPRPLVWTVLIFAMLSVLWGIGSLFYFSMRDHLR